MTSMNSSITLFAYMHKGKANIRFFRRLQLFDTGALSGTLILMALLLSILYSNVGCGVPAPDTGSLTATHGIRVTQSIGITPISTFVDGIDLVRSDGLAEASTVTLVSLQAELREVYNLTNQKVEVLVELWDQDKRTGESWVRLGSASMLPTSTGSVIGIDIPGVDAVLASVFERARLEGRLTLRFSPSASGTPIVDLIQYRFRGQSTFEFR